MTISTDQLRNLTDGSGDVVNAAGEKIGGIGQVYLDDSTGEPSWVTVKTGLFGTSESFVPLEGASVDGSNIRVSYDKETIKDAPRMAADGSLSPEEEETLYSYYNVSGHGGYTTDRSADLVDRDVNVVDRDADLDRDVNVVDRDVDVDRDGDIDRGRTTVGHDTSGPTTDDAMTLSEERLQVGTQTREAGRVRLRKYVVTENVTQTVPVSREEVRIEREPITDANIGAAESGPAISEEEHEVILHEEVPVVQKEAVPVERVRLNTETVTDQATVTEEVRKEQVDTDGDLDHNRVDDNRTTR